jgi:hypothetical protein
MNTRLIGLNSFPYYSPETALAFPVKGLEGGAVIAMAKLSYTHFLPDSIQVVNRTPNITKFRWLRCRSILKIATKYHIAALNNVATGGDSYFTGCQVLISLHLIEFRVVTNRAFDEPCHLTGWQFPGIVDADMRDAYSGFISSEWMNPPRFTAK